MTTHPLRWQSPQPLWTRLPSAESQARPTLLRFASDEFMDQMLATLARDPSQIDQRLTRWESWREPIADAPDAVERAPLPRLAQASKRSGFAIRSKAAIAERSDPATKPLKLYQPAHQRYYLASASLVCGVQGLPDRAVVAGGDEEVSFVMRRLLPAPGTTGAAESLREFAYVKDAQGARWQRCSEDTDASALVAGEERLPAFSLRFQDDAGAARALWSGLVPVGRREEYLGARVDPSVAPGFALGQRQSLVPAPAEVQDSVQARMVQFQMDVSEPWKTLIRSTYKLNAELAGTPSVGGDSEPAATRRLRGYDFNLRQAGASWLILLDCATHIATQMNDLWAVIEADGAGYAALSDARKSLYDWLDRASMSPELVTGLRPTDLGSDVRPPLASMRLALKALYESSVSDALEAATVSYNNQTLTTYPWPTSHFVLAGLNNALLADGPFVGLVSLSSSTSSVPADPLAGPIPGRDQAQLVDRFTALFARALDAQAPAGAPPLPFAAQVAKAMAANPEDFNDGGWFVLRYVYLRRDCGPLHPPLLSTPSERFKIASFFDADAPARPIRISLPLDTSPAGLRKHNRNTAFVLSDMLCGQVQRAKGLGLIDLVLSVLPWPLHKDLDLGEAGPCKSGGVNIGMICSLSIPIITICALILLMIIVSLLDLIFHWLPYFVFCFPVLGLKGKKTP